MISEELKANILSLINFEDCMDKEYPLSCMPADLEICRVCRNAEETYSHNPVCENMCYFRIDDQKEWKMRSRNKFLELLIPCTVRHGENTNVAVVCILLTHSENKVDIVFSNQLFYGDKIEELLQGTQNFFLKTKSCLC